MSFTVLGGTGFIGSHLVSYLRATGIDCYVPERDSKGIEKRPLGHVIDCIGLTADFRTRALDTVESHVCRLIPALRNWMFDSWLFLSSTRVYRQCTDATEQTRIPVTVEDGNDLYTLSKLMGESLCLHSKRDNVRIARLSNVCGHDLHSANFLCTVIRAAVDQGCVRFESSLESAKDYISIEDVVALLPKIAERGRHRIYNVASGSRLSNGDIASVVKEETGCRIEVVEGAPTVRFPDVDIARIREDFGFVAAPLTGCLRQLIASYKNRGKNDH